MFNGILSIRHDHSPPTNNTIISKRVLEKVSTQLQYDLWREDILGVLSYVILGQDR